MKRWFLLLLKQCAVASFATRMVLAEKIQYFFTKNWLPFCRNGVFEGWSLSFDTVTLFTHQIETLKERLFQISGLPSFLISLIVFASQPVNFVYFPRGKYSNLKKYSSYPSSYEIWFSKTVNTNLLIFSIQRCCQIIKRIRIKNGKKYDEFLRKTAGCMLVKSGWLDFHWNLAGGIYIVIDRVGNLVLKNLVLKNGQQQFRNFFYTMMLSNNKANKHKKRKKIRRIFEKNSRLYGESPLAGGI